MSIWEILAWIFYALGILGVLFGQGTWKINYRPVTNPLVQVLSVIIIYLFVGLIFSFFGLIGKFLLLPWKQLF